MDDLLFHEFPSLIGRLKTGSITKNSITQNVEEVGPLFLNKQEHHKEQHHAKPGFHPL